MTDVRMELRTASQLVEVPERAFERLAERRGLARRRQRLASLVVAAVVAAGSIGAFGALLALAGDDPAPEIPGAASRPIPALWPEHDTAQLRGTQDAVDAGDPSLEWRLDAEETAMRFVRTVLGWTNAEERLIHHANEGSGGLVTVELSTVPASCKQESCDVLNDVIVQLLRLGEADGIWSVIAAESPVFNMQFRIGQVVRVGDELEVISGHPSGSGIAIGVKVFEPCSGFNGVSTVVRDHRVTVSIARVEEGCLGYVYTLTPADGGTERGRTIFDGRSSSQEVIDEIAMAPVFISASDGSGSMSEVPQPEEA